VQPKLTVGPANDVYEQEADRVADQIMRMPDPQSQLEGESALPVRSSQNRIQQHSPKREIHRQTMDEEEEIEVLTGTSVEMSMKPLEPGKNDISKGAGSQHHTGVASPDVESEIQALRGTGEPLSEPNRNFFEPRFGYDFSQVQVHTDSRASQVARRVKAHAFTIGNDIVFGAGQYQPLSRQGKWLLAHELTHVVQQEAGGQRLRRSPACNCATIGRDPTAVEKSAANSLYPNLVDGDWCVTAPATPTYNCIAWTIGDTSKWIWNEVDTVYGDNDGTISVSDFDAFYQAHGFTPVENQTPTDRKIALFTKGGAPQHGAVISSHVCGVTLFESKRGKNIRIAHVLEQLEGGLYGNIEKYYV